VHAQTLCLLAATRTATHSAEAGVVLERSAYQLEQPSRKRVARSFPPPPRTTCTSFCAVAASVRSELKEQRQARSRPKGLVLSCSRACCCTLLAAKSLTLGVRAHTFFHRMPCRRRSANSTVQRGFCHACAALVLDSWKAPATDCAAPTART